MRFLVTSDLRLLGQNKDGLFAGPGQRKLSDLLNWSYPHGLMLDGAIVGVWGRKGGRVQVRTHVPLPRDLIEAEALSMPIPGATMALVIAEDE